MLTFVMIQEGLTKTDCLGKHMQRSRVYTDSIRRVYSVKRKLERRAFASDGSIETGSKQVSVHLEGIHPPFTNETPLNYISKSCDKVHNILLVIQKSARLGPRPN